VTKAVLEGSQHAGVALSRKEIARGPALDNGKVVTALSAWGKTEPVADEFALTGVDGWWG
jgi:hypothetical protein